MARKSKAERDAYRDGRLRQLRADETLCRAQHVWYLDMLAGFIRWWRRTVLLDEQP